MDATTLVGYLAGFLTTISYVPQALKIWRSKSAEDVSFKMFSCVTAGVALWLVFGILKHEPAMILWNGTSLVLSGLILAMKLRFG